MFIRDGSAIARLFSFSSFNLFKTNATNILYKFKENLKKRVHLKNFKKKKLK